MEITQNQQAINLAALLFVRSGFSLESSLNDGEVSALHVLKQVKAVVAGQANASDAMCAFFGLYRGPTFRSDDGLMVQCPDCGPCRLDLASQRSWQLDDEWLIRKLRGALDIAPQIPWTTPSLWLSMAVQRRLPVGASGRLAAWPHSFDRLSGEAICCALGAPKPSSIS